MSSAWSIRPAGPDDTEAQIAFRLAMFVEIRPELTSEELERFEEITRDYFARAIPAGEWLAWVATADDTGEVVSTGGIVLRHEPPTPGNMCGVEAYVLNVYTLPEWRRRGIAEAIMRAIIEHCEREKIPRVTLRATEAGSRVYSKLGFEPGYEMMFGIDPEACADY